MPQPATKLSGALQENLLVILTFNKEYAKIVRHSLTPALFESAVFKEIAGHACDYLDQFGGEPIGEHIADALEGILAGSDKRKSASYARVLDNLFQAKDSVNGEYCVSQLSKFIRQQQLKGALTKAIEAFEDGNVDDAELALQKGLQSQAFSFELGLNLRDADSALKFFDQADLGIMTGINELDKRDIVPRPGEMFLFIAPPKRGKSWFLIHIGKWALLQRKKVLHVSLELLYSNRLLIAASKLFPSPFALLPPLARSRLPKLIVLPN